MFSIIYAFHEKVVMNLQRSLIFYFTNQKFVSKEKNFSMRLLASLLISRGTVSADGKNTNERPVVNLPEATKLRDASQEKQDLNLDPCYINGDPNSGEKMCGEGFECKNWTMCDGISIAAGGSCYIWCVASNPCYFYNDRNGSVEHRNICSVDTNTGEILENNLICSNPTNCEGRSTIQGGQCEIDCATAPVDDIIFDPCYSNGDPSSDATICAQGFKCINPTNCNGINIVEGGHCETICEDDRDPCLPDGVQDRSPSTTLYF